MDFALIQLIHAIFVLFRWQPELTYPIDNRAAGKYILAVAYFTADDIADSSVELEVMAGNATDPEDALQNGKAFMFNCKMSTLCRQVVTDEQGRLMEFDLGDRGGETNTPTSNTVFLQ